MGLKSRNPKKVQLGLLLNVHTKFQLPNSRGGTALFQGEKGENPHIFLSN